jgi:hypothetical protein
MSNEQKNIVSEAETWLSKYWPETAVTLLVASAVLARGRLSGEVRKLTERTEQAGSAGARLVDDVGPPASGFGGSPDLTGLKWNSNTYGRATTREFGDAIRMPSDEALWGPGQSNTLRREAFRSYADPRTYVTPPFLRDGVDIGGIPSVTLGLGNRTGAERDELKALHDLLGFETDETKGALDNISYPLNGHRPPGYGAFHPDGQPRMPEGSFDNINLRGPVDPEIQRLWDESNRRIQFNRKDPLLRDGVDIGGRPPVMGLSDRVGAERDDLAALYRKFGIVPKDEV